MEYLVDMKNITVKFPGVLALDNVSFQLKAGEVHVLLGENGAGKSTLIKVLSGINRPTSGEILVNGHKYSQLSPEESVKCKISVIYQELSVVNELSIAENLFIGKLPVKKRAGLKTVDYDYMKKYAEKYLNEVGLHRDPMTLVQDISISEKQQVEIAKALSAEAKIIIMDEPTSSLSIQETENLLGIIRRLKEKGIGIIYISHKLKEIKKIGDRVTVLKDGKYIATREISELSEEDMIPLMVGRKVKDDFLSSQGIDVLKNEVIFSVKNMTRKDGSCKNISFDLHRGEILGFAGLIGAGRSECMEGIFGAKEISSGEIYLNNKKISPSNPYKALKSGIAMVTENRRESGFFANFPIWKEIAVSTSLRKSKLGGFSGFVHTREERKRAVTFIEQLKTKCSGIDQMTVNLSGGNQQKVIISKWLAADADIFIFDEPTKGIDVGAKSEIYQIMREMADKNKGVLMVSSEMPELLSTCDRIIVFKDGCISGEFINDNLTEEQIMYAAIHEK